MTNPRASRLPVLAAAVSLLLASVSSAQQNPTAALTLQDVMQRAVAAAAAFERELAAVVADEHFVQRGQNRIGKDGARREMRSDFLLVRIPGQDGWRPFRDVYEVDRRVVRDRTERLQKLFIDNPLNAVGAASQISTESSRYNIGSVFRTINVPTFGLLLLNPEYLKRFEFRKRSEEKVTGVATWRITFEEQARPTVVRTLKGDDVRLEGSLWIEPGTGRVIKTLVKTVGTPDPGELRPRIPGLTSMRVETTFAPSDTLGLWVPVTMSEWAKALDGYEVEGTATYSRFRRFTVKTSETFQGR